MNLLQRILRLPVKFLLLLPFPIRKYITYLELYINHVSMFKKMEQAEVIYTNVVLALLFWFLKWFIPFCRKNLNPK